MAIKNKRQIRKETGIDPSTSASSELSKPSDFNPDYGPVVKDLRRIGILAGSFITILIVLSFFLR